ncbi:MAG: phosphatidate cytidylyltransferase [Bacillota bacterium]
MLSKRVLAALIGGPAFLGLAYLGGFSFLAMVAVLGVTGYLEYAGMLRVKGHRVMVFPGIVLGISILWWMLFPKGSWVLVVGLILPVLGRLAGGTRYSILDLWISLGGSLYIFGLLGFALRLRGLQEGFQAVFLLVAVVWTLDTSAYFVGRAWGRRRLWPRVSPKKTWEGALGGTLAALAAGVLVAYLLGHSVTTGFWVALAGSIAGQAGDLVESAVKRYAGVKDSGHLIPGHGGILDRFDSLMLAAPWVYLVVKFLG